MHAHQQQIDMSIFRAKKLSCQQSLSLSYTCILCFFIMQLNNSSCTSILALHESLTAAEQHDTASCGYLIFNHFTELFAMLQVFQTACRQGHFRLTVHTSGESGSVDFGMHAFTVGAAVISLMRWLSELRERLPKDGPAMLRQQVCMTVNKGKPSREHAYPNIKAAITSLLQGCHSPFR